MNRRSFLKRIAIAAAGVTGVGLLIEKAKVAWPGLLPADKVPALIHSPADYINVMCRDADRVTGRINSVLPLPFYDTSPIPTINRSAFGETYVVGPKLCLLQPRKDFISSYVACTNAIRHAMRQVQAKRVIEIRWKQLMDADANFWGDYAEPWIAFET